MPPLELLSPVVLSWFLRVSGVPVFCAPWVVSAVSSSFADFWCWFDFLTSDLDLNCEWLSFNKDPELSKIACYTIFDFSYIIHMPVNPCNWQFTGIRWKCWTDCYNGKWMEIEFFIRECWIRILITQLPGKSVQGFTLLLSSRLFVSTVRRESILLSMANTKVLQSRKISMVSLNLEEESIWQKC